MHDSDENLLPITSETDSEMAALDAQQGEDPVPLRREAATAGMLPAERAQETIEEADA